MVIKEIQEFAEIRTKARAYFCYLMSRYLPNKTENISLQEIQESTKKLKKNIPHFEAIYVLDSKGKQVTKNLSKDERYKDKGFGKNRVDRAYFYRAVREKRCVLTNPYPSLLGNNMVVTASYPIYGKKNELLYIVSIDISLEHILQMIHPSSVDSFFGKVSKYAYGAFSVALLAIAILLFTKSIGSLYINNLNLEALDIKELFEATILLTLSLAIFDLTKAIFEEEVLGHHKKQEADDIHKTMVRFIGSIIIALAIEALMLVFKFAIIDPSKLINAVYIIGALSMLLISLSIYIKSIKK
jgi:hypothetical protein